MRYVGIDLAWRETNRTGLATVDQAGRFVSSGVVRSDDEIEGWLAVHAVGARVVAVDAPLIVPNATGQRVAEKRIGQAYGRFGASAYPANRSNQLFDPPRAETLALRFGWQNDPEAPVLDGQTRCIEVYPHPALVGLFELPERVLYKKGSDRRAGFLQLMELIESVPELVVTASPRWQELRRIVADPRRGDLSRIEDELDAIVCAHLAWLWDNRPAVLSVYGSFSEGYIVAPPAPTHAAAVGRPAKAAPAIEVVEVWGVEPGTTSTRRGREWAQAILRATEGREMFQPAARLSLVVDFVLPVGRTSQEQWDLDNLLKPTIDGLTALLGTRVINTPVPQADDERIDRIVASKRTAAPGEQPGARLELRVV